MHSKDLWVSENSIKLFDLKLCTAKRRAKRKWRWNCQSVGRSSKNKQRIVTIDRWTICRNFYFFADKIRTWIGGTWGYLCGSVNSYRRRRQCIAGCCSFRLSIWSCLSSRYSHFRYNGMVLWAFLQHNQSIRILS